MRRSILLASALLATIVIFTACGSDSDRDPVTLASDYNAAYNAGDLAALASSYYTQDTVFSFDPGIPGAPVDTDTGIAEVLARDAEEIAGGQQLTLSNLNADGATVTGNFSATSDELAPAGLAPLTGSFVMETREGKIASIAAKADAASQQKLGAAAIPRRFSLSFLRTYE